MYVEQILNIPFFVHTKTLTSTSGNLSFTLIQSLAFILLLNGNTFLCYLHFCICPQLTRDNTHHTRSTFRIFRNQSLRNLPLLQETGTPFRLQTLVSYYKLFNSSSSVGNNSSSRNAITLKKKSQKYVGTPL